MRSFPAYTWPFWLKSFHNMGVLELNILGKLDHLWLEKILIELINSVHDVILIFWSTELWHCIVLWSWVPHPPNCNMVTTQNTTIWISISMKSSNSEVVTCVLISGVVYNHVTEICVFWDTSVKNCVLKNVAHAWHECWGCYLVDMKYSSCAMLTMRSISVRYWNIITLTVYGILLDDIQYADAF
jgi:hypothetical protein